MIKDLFLGEGLIDDSVFLADVQCIAMLWPLARLDHYLTMSVSEARAIRGCAQDSLFFLWYSAELRSVRCY